MNKTNFCHIVPVPHLDLVKGRPVHLVLAHLLDDEDYVEFYKKEKANGSIIILDNSGFELYKQGKPMFDSDKLIACGRKINADYIVMSDYPGEDSLKTVAAAERLAPQFKDAGFKTFFVPQGRVGDLEDLMDAWEWAVDHPELVDYISPSILSAPLACNVESGNKLQRFVARLYLMYILKDAGFLDQARANGQKIHFLGMVDGPNEVMFMSPFADYIDTWDSSAGAWLGLNGETFDYSPTGRNDGKFELEVDFSFETDNENLIEMAEENIGRIDDTVDYLLNGKEDV